MKIKIEYLLFYVSYFFFSLYSFFGIIDTYKNPLKYLTYFSMALIVIEFIIQLKKYKYKELIRLILLLSLSIIFVFKTNNFLILKLILIIISVRNIDLDTQVKFDLKLRILFLFLMFILLKLGIATDTTAFFDGKIRHSLGFTNPNVLGHHVLILCMEIMFLKRNKKYFISGLICFFIMFISYLYSGSRTAVLLFALLMICFITFNFKPEIYEKNYIKRLIIYSSLWTTVLVFFLFYLYKSGNVLGLEIDRILSGRLFNIHFFSNNFSVSLLGTDISIANKSCDTASVYMLYAFGVVGLLVYIISFVKLFVNLYKRKDYPLIIIMFIFVIYGISEKLWLFADCNLLLTCLKENIFIPDKEEKNERRINKHHCSYI